MCQKEFCIVLICYGGVSFVVYMYGVIKELWKFIWVSQVVVVGSGKLVGVEYVYRCLFQWIEIEKGLWLCVMNDVIVGVSVGGFNGVFLVQVIYLGQLFELLIWFWFEWVDVDVLFDFDVWLWLCFVKFWVMLIVWYLLKCLGNVVFVSVVFEMCVEVCVKFLWLICLCWFELLFGGFGFFKLLCEVFDVMVVSGVGELLLLFGYLLDLFVIVIDFKGYMEVLCLYSLLLVEESEYCLLIGFYLVMLFIGGFDFVLLFELVFVLCVMVSFFGVFFLLCFEEIEEFV